MEIVGTDLDINYISYTGFIEPEQDINYISYTGNNRTRYKLYLIYCEYS